MAVDLVEGWTGAVDWVLKADGVALPLTGLTATLVLRDRTGALITTTSTGGANDLSVYDSTGGVVRFSPDAGDLKASRSPYTARVKVVDSTGSVVFFPNGLPETITVRDR